MAYLIVHGWEGSGPDHWQTWLAGRLRDAGEQVSYPDLPDADLPALDPWLAALAAELEELPPHPVVLCHSLGCIAWFHHLARGGAPAARVLLVAPPAPIAELPTFFPVPASLSIPGGELWFADNDPYCQQRADLLYGERYSLPMRLFGGGGHLNTDAGYGAWHAVEEWALGPLA